VGRWYWSLVLDQLQSDSTIKQVAAQVTAGLYGDVDKVRALHRFVIEKTRYVGLEFGIHGTSPIGQPGAATSVLVTAKTRPCC